MQNILDAHKEGLEFKESTPVWHTLPLTVSFLVNLSSKEQTNSLIGSALDESGEVWRLYTLPKTGYLCFEVSDRGVNNRKLITHNLDLCDGSWHRIQLDITPTVVTITRDGRSVIRVNNPLTHVNPQGGATTWIGCFPPTTGSCVGQLADIVLKRKQETLQMVVFDSDRARRIPFVPDGPTPLPPRPTVPPAANASKTNGTTRTSNASDARVPTQSLETRGPLQVSLITFPSFPGALAVWGSVGRDREGQIWMSPASHFVESESARLFRYDPRKDTLTAVSDVLTELKRVKLYRQGMKQAKIHTKYIQGNDGYLYFASMCDPEPGDVGQFAPRYGSHVWRIKPSMAHWEHVLSVPEGLISLAGNGSVLYGLAFPDHTLLKIDVKTKTCTRVKIGSVEGHISRHMICDHRGHAYVPRMQDVRSRDAAMTLVELDPDLKKLAEFPLPNYKYGSARDSHGITAVQPLPDRSIVFTTSAGRLFRIRTPNNSGPSTLENLGWFHPAGMSYPSGLFLGKGGATLVGLAQPGRPERNAWDWITFSLKSKRSTAIPFPLARPSGWVDSIPLLYGCMTTDNEGNYYVGGCYRNEASKGTPVVLKIRSGRP